jgi:2'-5' RNA ligase
MQIHACVRLSAEATAHLADALNADLRRTDQVHWMPPQLWRLRLAGFGHVTRGDAVRLAALLRDSLAQQPAAVVRLAGIEPLPFDDDGVWAHTSGSVEALASIAAALPRCVHALGFVPDRRAYRSAVLLGRVTAQTKLPYLEDLADRLADYEGPAWRVESIALATLRGAESESEVLGVFDEIPLHGEAAEGAEDAEGADRAEGAELPSDRGMPSSHATASTPPATNATFCPDTASREA